jgi:hypothetical protein
MSNKQLPRAERSKISEREMDVYGLWPTVRSKIYVRSTVYGLQSATVYSLLFIICSLLVYLYVKIALVFRFQQCIARFSEGYNLQTTYRHQKFNQVCCLQVTTTYTF